MTYSGSAIRLASQDHLGRAPTVGALHGVRSDPDLNTPLVVRAYGGWGIGKTSVMQIVGQMLTTNGQQAAAAPRRC